MVDRTREQLLGYLFGALEESERESVASQLAQDPNLRRELARLHQRLEPLGGTQPDFMPPAGLAKRTCRLVESYPPPCAESAWNGTAAAGAT
jgi:anti-sigma-K factor RskA